MNISFPSSTECPEFSLPYFFCPEPSAQLGIEEAKTRYVPFEVSSRLLKNRISLRYLKTPDNRPVLSSSSSLLLAGIPWKC